VGAAIGTALGLVGSRVLLERSGADLGAGYFGGHEGAFAPDPGALAGIALLGVAMGLAGALWVARAMNRVPVADALRDRAMDLPLAAGAPPWLALALFAAGIPLVFVPSAGGLPLGGYGAIALWLAAAATAVAPLCGLLLGRWAPAGPVASLAIAQVRHLPGHLAASIAGIVVSASVCVAMAIMVFSFRVSLQDWLVGVVGADLYARSSSTFDGSFFSDGDQRVIAGLAQVASIEPLRYDRLVLGDKAPPLSLVARPVDARILAGFQAEPPGMPAPADAIVVWISEAARDLHGWRPGMSVQLPIAGRNVDVRIHGVIRDYARTWGAVLMPIGDYRRLTNDLRANDIAIHLRRGADPGATETAIRAALPASKGLQFEEAGELRRRSLEIFERSFAVTYALEAITIVIGLAGVTSSFAALAWSRRREFGVLRFLGFTRRELLRMIAAEGAAAGALGSAIGLVAGAAISLVLLHVVNRQSFHWSLEVHWPVAALFALVAGIVATCAIGARVSGAFAVRHEAILAVKDDA
jgi:putative ABC transport system permease protein